MSWSLVEISGERSVTVTDPGDGSAVTVRAPATAVTLELAGTGLQGPQGPAGPSGGAAEEVYRFAAPLPAWGVAHTLPVAYPGVVALDADGVPVVGDVTYPAPGTVRVAWAWPMAGTLVLTT